MTAPRWRLRRSDPMLRNGYALVLNVGLTTVLGVLFWIVAARTYSAADVGRGSALVSALILLSNLSQLGMVNGLVRFLPTAGNRSGRLVAHGYAVSGGLAVLLGFGFTLLAPWLSPQLAFLHGSFLASLAFAAAVLVWVVFALQDAAMTGLRRAVWVPVENGVYGVLKLAALVPLAAVAPHLGVVAAWVLPVLLLVVPVNLAIFRRWAPQQALLPPVDGRPTGLRGILRFLSFDYAGQVCYQLATSALPLVVVALLGVTSNGHFYIAWTIAVCLDLLSINLAQSLTVESALDPRRLAELLRRLVPRLAAIQGTNVAVLLIGTPLLLSFYGRGYVVESTTPMRLLALGLLPRAVIVTTIAIARVRRRTERVFAIQAATAVGVLGLSFTLAPSWGLTGVATAWLLTQAAIATAVLPRLIREVRGRSPEADVRVSDTAASR